MRMSKVNRNGAIFYVVLNRSRVYMGTMDKRKAKNQLHRLSGRRAARVHALLRAWDRPLEDC